MITRFIISEKNKKTIDLSASGKIVFWEIERNEDVLFGY
jgi:hypothetical protein